MAKLLSLVGALLPFVPQTQAQGYTNASELPYYGLSPPVYPTRKLSTTLACKTD